MHESSFVLISFVSHTISIVVMNWSVIIKRVKHDEVGQSSNPLFKGTRLQAQGGFRGGLTAFSSGYAEPSCRLQEYRLLPSSGCT